MGNLKASVFIATPCYGGLNHVFYTMGLIQATQVFASNRILMYYGFTQNESLITRGRNRLTYDFLNTDCTHLMFIDADIGFNPEDIIKMIDADKEIICGLYPKKEIDWPRVKEAVENGVPASELHNHTGSFVVNFADGAKVVETRMNEPFEIENGGTGFMLIKREVFEKLDVPEYLNDMHTAVQFEDGAEQEKIKEFFATSIDEETGGRLLSEDFHFCKIARKKGIKVWAAPWAQLVHCGTYNFQGNVIRQF
jgi:hypothetical protein